HEALQPWDGLQCYASAALYMGPASLYLGMLERLMGRHQEAERHLEDTIVACDEVDSIAAGGMARAELIVLLEARGAERDAARAARLRAEIDERVRDHDLFGLFQHLEIVRATT